MNQKCKTDQTNHIHFLPDLTQICTQKYYQKCNQLLNFPVLTKIASGSYQGDFLTRIDWALEGYFSFSSKKSDYLATTKMHRKTFRNFNLVLEIPCTVKVIHYINLCINVISYCYMSIKLCFTVVESTTEQYLFLISNAILKYNLQ